MGSADEDLPADVKMGQPVGIAGEKPFPRCPPGRMSSAIRFRFPDGRGHGDGKEFSQTEVRA
ncbi:MAG: hypothetical protein MZV70_44845 [Desulfobacterales bacterium]|nr:hypothetical protein [Desulfobacterales bacterium]